jgi:hypothetical protein
VFFSCSVFHDRYNLAYRPTSDELESAERTKDIIIPTAARPQVCPKPSMSARVTMKTDRQASSPSETSRLKGSEDWLAGIDYVISAVMAQTKYS